MKIKQLNPAFLVILAVAASIAFTACDNSFGVFHEIQTEKAQVGTDVFKNVTVKALAEDSLNYYAAMAKVFYRPISGDTWLVMPVNGDSDYYCVGLTSNGAGTVYIGTANTSTTALKGIYSTANSGTNWTKMDSGEFAAKIVDSLIYANGKLFVAAHTGTEDGSTFDLYYYDGSAFVSAGLTGLASPVLGLAHGDSAYWTITSSKLYRTTTLGTFTEQTASGPSSAGETLKAIASDSAGKVHVTTSDGDLYTRSASTWTSDNLASSVSLGVLAEVPVDDTASAYRLLVAKHNSGNGYYEYNAVTKADPLVGNNADAIFAPTASSYTTTIYSKPVIAYYYSAANKTLLIGLASQGTDTYALYSNTVSGSTWSGWTAE